MTDSESAGPIFQRWVRTEIEPFLAELGWKRRGLAFERTRAGNTGFIEIRRSKWSTRVLYEFMVDVAVFSPRLAQEFAAHTELDTPARPKPIDSSLSQPLGWLIGEHSDVFWRVRAPSLSLELAALGESVRDKLARYAIPWLDAHATDEQLRDAFLEFASDAGPLELRQLHRLLTDLGPKERLTEVEELMRTEPERTAERYADALVRDPFGADDEDVRAADAAMRSLGQGRTD